MAIKNKNRKANASPSAAPAPAPDTARPSNPSVFPIVGVGASAGGIDAFTELLRKLPESPALAFIYVLHQEAKHQSSLAQVIARASKMPVSTAEDGTVIAPAHVYVAPPAADITVEQGVIRVEQHKGSPTLPIDHFLRSLADDQGPRAIGVILSGSASDGSLGMRAIKAEGGITFAQDDTAKFTSMPRSAIAAGSIDFVLSPDAMAEELVRIARQISLLVQPARFPESELQKLFSALRVSHDVDFTHYKPSTIERRIRRRMALHRVETLPEYLKIIRERPSETEELYGDLLIRVTGFFRDPAVFETLQREVFPKMLKERPDNDTVRVWVPGCATGEEVYSVAIALLETSSNGGFTCPIQIFGTDVSEAAIERARAGMYAENIAAEVSPDRLRRFFNRAEGGYRVSKAVRDCCIFARQNVTKDPPFSKLDLISCRNVMIYLGAVLQRKVMSIFHYALRPNGFLLLGSSETIAAYGEMFEVFDRKHKVYRRKPGGRIHDVAFEAATPRALAEHARIDEEMQPASNPFREADRVLLGRYAPPGVLINDNMDIIQFRGRTSPFLEPAPGTASFSLLKMLREGLLADVRAAIHAARKKNAPERREGIRMKVNGVNATVNVEVVPFLTPAQERLQLVLFELLPEEKKRSAKKAAKTDPSEVQRIQRELLATREYLQSIIEEQEAMNEELRSANEEIQSSNEELQSTNEELETAKEELQSSNEELTTLNEELENRNQELAQLNNDLINLFASIEIPVVMLDGGLRIRRFNPPAQRALNLIPSDLGRPIGELKTSLSVDHIDRLIAEVIDSLEMRTVEVRDGGGRLYTLRVRPYRTADNKIDGAVLALIDVENPKRVS